MTMEKTIEESKQGESLVLENKAQNSKKLFIESYGCAMNFSDSEVVASILSENNYNTTTILEEADLVLINTCSIRDKAEQTIRKRLEKYNAVKRDLNPKMKLSFMTLRQFPITLWKNGHSTERAFTVSVLWQVSVYVLQWDFLSVRKTERFI